MDVGGWSILAVIFFFFFGGGVLYPLTVLL